MMGLSSWKCVPVDKYNRNGYQTGTYIGDYLISCHYVLDEAFVF